jgi:hypothetical protein
MVAQLAQKTFHHGLMPSGKTKKPFKRLWLEGLHPVCLTLFYGMPVLCLSQSETAAKHPFLPHFILRQKCAFFKGLKTMAIWQGRSSDSPALLATFPSRLVETVAFTAKRVLSL